ncbi:MAG TPA: hypothetical protein VHZ24_08370 [Pirellulales bacterium]|nr:hypothetical protein [Pirellulales bacterium]
MKSKRLLPEHNFVLPLTLLGWLLSTQAYAQQPVVPVAQEFLVGAYYFSGWWRDPPTHFKPERPTPGMDDWRAKFPEREPLTGWYDDRQEIMDRQIDLAADGGLSFFCFDWFPRRPGQSMPGAEQNNLNGLHFFVASPKKNRLRFNLTYVNHPPFGMGMPEWQRTVDEWVGYFKDPRYLRVNGKAVFVVYDAAEMLKGMGNSPAHVQAAIGLLRQRAAASGAGELMVGGGLQWTGPNGSYAKHFASQGYDFYTAYDYPIEFLEPKGRDYADLIGLQQQLLEGFAQVSPVPYVPVVDTNSDTRTILADRAAWFAGSTPAKFRSMLEMAKKLILSDPKFRAPAPNGGQPLLFIYAWNELSEGGILVPTKGDNGAYLEQVKKVFRP